MTLLLLSPEVRHTSVLYLTIIFLIVASDHFQINVTLDGTQLNLSLFYSCRFSVPDNDIILSETTFDNFSEEIPTGVCQYNFAWELRIPAGRGKRFFS